MSINGYRDDRPEHNERQPAIDIEAAAERLRAAMSEAEERADAITDEDIKRNLNDLLVRAGVRRPEDGVPTIEEIDLDLFRLSWEIEYGAAGAAPAVRGDANTGHSCRRILHDDTFEELHGSRAVGVRPGAAHRRGGRRRGRNPVGYRYRGRRGRGRR